VREEREREKVEERILELWPREAAVAVRSVVSHSCLESGTRNVLVGWRPCNWQNYGLDFIAYLAFDLR